MEIKEKIQNSVQAYGVNTKVIGYEMVCDLIYLMYLEKKKGKKSNMNDFYSQLATKYNISVLSIGNSLRYAVCTSNEYGRGLNPKTLVQNVLQKL